jgi:positive regulator of sigma E activity
MLIIFGSSVLAFIFATRLVRKRWKKAKNPVSLRAVLIQ